MKRDDDYLRKLLLEIEEKPDFLVLVSQAIGRKPDERRREYHIELLCDAGLMARISKGGYRMTNQGHDYLEAIRDKGIWESTKAAVLETGGSATLEILKQVATGFLKKKLTMHTGIEL